MTPGFCLFSRRVRGRNFIERRKREEAIHEIGRVLKPGGWVGIIDSFQYAGIFKKMGWKNVHASGVRLKMFPPVKWTTGKKRNSLLR